MKAKIWWMLAIASAALPSLALAGVETYDLDIVMTGGTGLPPSVTFSGSLSFDAAGAGFCSAAFCASGQTPEFSNVKVADPLSIDPPTGAFAFTDEQGAQSASGATINLFDTYLGTPGQSSFVYELGFTTNAPLGGSTTTFDLNNIYFSKDSNVTGTWSCGGPDRLPSGGVSCPVATLTLASSSVPEPGFVWLLLSGLCSLVALGRPAVFRS